MLKKDIKGESLKLCRIVSNHGSDCMDKYRDLRIFPNLKRLTNLPAIRGVAMLSGLVKLTTMLIELGD
jgi:hypothetical protein